MFRTSDEINFSAEDLPRIPRPRRVLLTTPQHYDVVYVINPHMAEHVGSVNYRRAQQQWESVRDAYESLDLDVHIIPGAEGFPDMVFCANQVLPVYHDAGAEPDASTQRPHTAILSRMFNEVRRGEVAHFQRFFEDQGYRTVRLPEVVKAYEGMGDSLWHPGRALLWGGFGFRSDPAVYEFIERRLQIPVVGLLLEDPDFYHLDTCLSVLDEKACLIFPGAFDSDGLGLIHRLFEQVLEAPEREARRLFAVNAHCPDGRHVIIQEGCDETNAVLATAGYVPVPVPTSEFLKAGGSVFCMKQMFW